MLLLAAQGRSYRMTSASCAVLFDLQIAICCDLKVELVRSSFAKTPDRMILPVRHNVLTG